MDTNKSKKRNSENNQILSHFIKRYKNNERIENRKMSMHYLNIFKLFNLILIYFWVGFGLITLIVMTRITIIEL